MKVYDPRLDTSPGANVSDERFHVETKNPALIFAALCPPQPGQTFWESIIEQAIYCEAEVPAPMTEARARELLKPWINDKRAAFADVGDLRANDPGHDIIEWVAEPDEENPEIHATAYVDGRFSPDQFEAIAWWMRNKARG